MIKKSFAVLGVAAAFFAQAQDVSTLKNAMDVYSDKSVGASAKYDAMAGSNGALGGEATSLLTNPAGLGVAIASNITGSLSVNSYDNSSRMGSNTLSYSNKSIALANLGGIVAFQPENPESPVKFVNVGFNYSNRTLDDYIETPGNSSIVIQKNLLDASNNPVTGNLTLDRHAYDRTGNVSDLGVGVGANIMNQFFIGGGLKMKGVTLEQYDTARFQLDLDNSVQNYYKQYTPYSEEASGVALNVGVIGKIGHMIRLGVSVETPTWWNIERTYSDYYTDSNGYISVETLAEDRKLRTPLHATFSAGLVPTKNFAVNVDYTVGFTKPQYTVYGDAETELNNFFTDYYKNTQEVKVGAEYRISGFRLRGGFAHATSPFDGISVSTITNSGASMYGYDNLILGKRTTVGAGLGYDWKKFFLDFTYQNQTSTYSNPFLYGQVMNASPYYSSGYHSSDFDVVSSNYAVSEVKNVKNNFVIGLGFKF